MLIQKVLAQTVPTEVTIPGKLNITTLADAFGLAINVVLGAGIALTIVFLILGGIKYMSSKGDQKAAQEARNALTNAVIGFIVVIGAFTIRIIVTNVVGGESDIYIEAVTPKGL